MASEETGQERTEQPSARRREQARAQGRVAVSPDLTAAATLLASLGVLALTAGALTASAIQTMAGRLTVLPRADLTIDDALETARHVFEDAARLSAPLLLGVLLVGVAVHLGQTRAALTTEGLRPRWSRLSPGAHLARLFSGRGAVSLLKALLKLAVVGLVAVITLREEWPRLMSGGAATPATWLAVVGGTVGRLWLRIGVGYLVLAALDYAYQWWQHAQSLRMTREEVRQESRETEASPTVRQRVRALHQKMASRRMMAEVRRADVVVRNPTHVAVALRYQAGRMRAPRVVAKGERLLALRIIEEAQSHGVPVVENRSLARALFAAVEIGREVPPALYRAVAEVLAYVYSLTRGRR